MDSLCIASANMTAFSMTAALRDGKTPGKPVQIGQIFVLGGSSHESALHPQNIFVTVFNWI
jgi:hypothetical protein